MRATEPHLRAPGPDRKPTDDPGASSPWLDTTPHDDLVSAIEHAVTSVFAISREDLWRPSRGVARVALARQTAMYLAHVAAGRSLTEVGAMFDRDRTTAAHACAVIEDRRDDPAFDRAVDLLERAIVTLAARHRQPTVGATPGAATPSAEDSPAP